MKGRQMQQTGGNRRNSRSGVKMGSLSCFILISLSLSSLGSCGQTIDNSQSILPRQAILFPDSPDSVSVEGSGQNHDDFTKHQTPFSHFPQKLRQDKIPEAIPSTSSSLETKVGIKNQTSDAGQVQASDQVITADLHEGALVEDSLVARGEQLKHLSVTNDHDLTGMETYVFSSMAEKDVSERLCFFGTRPCIIPKTVNGTSLLWNDMRRTLAFAWELHVFGSAGLFILMVVLAAFGMAGACTLTSPLHGDLILPNSLLIVSGSLRAVLLLLDPYGTRQIVSHATLAALHNVPMQLLLWTQVSLPLITLRGLKMLPFPRKLMHPCMLGGLAILHTSLLVVADLCPLFSFPELPIVLQTLSFSWGLLFCVGILVKTLLYKKVHRGSSAAQCGVAQRIARRAQQVTIVCAFFGTLCCCLQIFSLLWLYGLLGNWRRFGWGWWLCQFWARILEISWGFSLLILGSWIFWSPISCHKKVNNGKDKSGGLKSEKKMLWGRIVSFIQGMPFKKTPESWLHLIPNNWAKHNPSEVSNITSPYDNQPSTNASDCKPDHVGCYDSQEASLWRKLNERECILSLIEFEMRPPSPINLRRSIDNALSPRHLIPGGLFTPPPPAWSHTLGQDTSEQETRILPQAYAGFGWILETESTPVSPDHFGTRNASADHSLISESNHSHRENLNSRYSAGMYQHEWSDDDVTDL
ncbi:proline-rich transmembrane protein 3 [Synchiropus picturatus]